MYLDLNGLESNGSLGTFEMLWVALLCTFWVQVVVLSPEGDRTLRMIRGLPCLEALSHALGEMSTTWKAK